MKILFYANDSGATNLLNEHYQTSHDIVITQDINFYKNYQDADVKIAYCNERFIGKIIENELIAQELRPISKLVIFELGEMMYTEVIDVTIGENVYYLVPGFLDKYDSSQFIFLPNFFIEMKNFYLDNLSWVLDELDPYSVKPYYFDSLLGTQKAHRDVIYNGIIDRNLQDKILLNYTATRNNLLTESQNYFWEPGTTDNETISYSGHYVRFHGLQMPASSVLPVHSVYNKSCYSIVAETAYEPGSPVFFTEKIVKPILAKRLFVIFSVPNYLQKLRELGFKTFDTVIDETYDTIEDDLARWQAAFKQIVWLCSQDQKVVLEKIKPIVDHNYGVLCGTNWRHRAKKDLLKLIDSNLNSFYN